MVIRKWRQKNVEQRIRRSRMTICSIPWVRKSNRPRQTRFSAHAANRYVIIFSLVLILSMTHIELHRESVAIVKRKRGALMSLWQYVTSFSDPQLYTHYGLLDICNVCEHMSCILVSWLIVTLWNYRCTNCNNRWTLWFTPRMRLTDRRL